MKRFVCTGRGQVGWQEVEDRALQPNEVRVRNWYGTEKHGTMMAFFKGYANDRGRWDADALMHRPGEGELWSYPIPLGNMQYGEIVEVGAEVEHRHVGDVVFFSDGFRPVSVVPWHQVFPATQGMEWEDAMMLDPLEFALGALRDGNVRIGDHLAIFGLGAIGLALVQAAIAAGAERIFAIDPILDRRDIAEKLGADACLDPTGTDVGAVLRELADGIGVDVAIDFSGSRHALQAAIRGVGYGGTVVCGAFPPPYDGGLDFGGEAHMNRPKIVFSRACSDPNPDYPRWDHTRIRWAAYELIARSQVRGGEIIGPIIDFEDLPKVYPRIAEDPQRHLKLAVRYPQ